MKLNNIKMKNKMTLGFTALVILSIVLSVLSGTQLDKIGRAGYNTVTDNLQSLEYLNTMQGAYNNVLIHLKNTYFAIDDDSRERFKGLVADSTNTFYEQADLYLDFARDKNKLDDVEKMDELVRIMQEHEALRTEAFRLAAAGDSTGANNFSTGTIMPVGNQVAGLLGELYADNVSSIESTAAGNYESSQTITFIVMIVGVCSVLLAICNGYFITKDITVPVKRLTDASNNLAKGNFNINLKAYHNDELGKLTEDINEVVTILKNFIDNMNMAVERHLNGEMDVLIDDSSFEGGFKEVAQGFNTILAIEKSTLNDIMSTLSDFSQGNFDSNIRPLPGEKVVFNDSMNNIKDNFISISSDINMLLNNAIEGNLNYRADASNYQGDWSNIIGSINNLLEVIINPIEITSNTLDKMSDGNFQFIHEDFKGDYAIIKEAMNKTQTVLSKYVEEISYILRELSNQNLDVSIYTEYKGVFKPIQNSMEGIISAFNTLLFDLSETAKSVAEGTKYLSDSSIEDSRGSEQMFIAVQNISNSVEDISSKTRSNVEISNSANELAKKAMVSVTSGNGEMEAMLVSMEEISKASDGISKIIKVIEDIAFQTNLLALNASVEAARAGEHGKGFAVVAEEVRNLSGRSSNAAKESALLIEESIKRVGEGRKIANETAKSLKSTETQIHEVSNLISQISKFSDGQHSSIDIVNEEVSKLADAAQMASAKSLEKVEVVRQISDSAEQLKIMVERFHLKF